MQMKYTDFVLRKEEIKMAKFYSMEIAGCKRDLELFKVNDNLYIAAFIIFGDVEITKAAARELLKKAPVFPLFMKWLPRQVLTTISLPVKLLRSI